MLTTVEIQSSYLEQSILLGAATLLISIGSYLFVYENVAAFHPKTPLSGIDHSSMQLRFLVVLKVYKMKSVT